MEDLLLRRPDEIRKRQLAMKKVALLFTFGLGKDAHRYHDGFDRIMKALRFYLDHLPQNQTWENWSLRQSPFESSLDLERIPNITLLGS
jgi:hypothetical protein